MGSDRCYEEAKENQKHVNFVMVPMAFVYCSLQLSQASLCMYRSFCYDVILSLIALGALKSRKDDLLRKALASRSAVLDSDDDTQQSLTRHMMSELTSSMRGLQCFYNSSLQERHGTCIDTNISA